MDNHDLTTDLNSMLDEDFGSGSLIVPTIGMARFAPLNAKQVRSIVDAVTPKIRPALIPGIASDLLQVTVGALVNKWQEDTLPKALETWTDYWERHAERGVIPLPAIDKALTQPPWSMSANLQRQTRATWRKQGIISSPAGSGLLLDEAVALWTWRSILPEAYGQSKRPTIPAGGWEVYEWTHPTADPIIISVIAERTSAALQWTPWRGASALVGWANTMSGAARWVGPRLDPQQLQDWWGAYADPLVVPDQDMLLEHYIQHFIRLCAS